MTNRDYRTCLKDKRQQRDEQSLHSLCVTGSVCLSSISSDRTTTGPVMPRPGVTGEQSPGVLHLLCGWSPLVYAARGHIGFVHGQRVT
jgi:hypothetical protein